MNNQILQLQTLPLMVNETYNKKYHNYINDTVSILPQEFRTNELFNNLLKSIRFRGNNLTKRKTKSKNKKDTGTKSEITKYLVQLHSYMLF